MWPGDQNQGLESSWESNTSQVPIPDAARSLSSLLSASLLLSLCTSTSSVFFLPRVEGDRPQPLSLCGLSQGVVGPWWRNNLTGVHFYSWFQVWSRTWESYCTDSDKGGHCWSWEWGQGSSQGLRVYPLYPVQKSKCVLLHAKFWERSATQ